MNIEAHIDQKYIIIQIGADVSLESLKEYQYKNIDYLRFSNSIYDLSLFDFSNITTDDIINYIKDLKVLAPQFVAKKSAFVTPSEEGQVILRLFKHYAKKELDLIIEIFSEKRLAMDWLATQEDIVCSY